MRLVSKLVLALLVITASSAFADAQEEVDKRQRFISSHLAALLRSFNGFASQWKSICPPPQVPKVSQVAIFGSTNEFAFELASFESFVQEIGSKKALETIQLIKLQYLDEDGKEASEMLRFANKVLVRMQGAQSLERLHFAATTFVAKPSGNTQLLHSMLQSFIEFYAGLRAIVILLPEVGFELERDVLVRFYKDEDHPMDLQKFLRHPIKAREAIAVIRNLSLLTKHLDPGENQWLREENVDAFNEFLRLFMKLRPLKITRNALLDVLSIPPKSNKIRSANMAYFKIFGVSLGTVIGHLTFSKSPLHGIYLFPIEQTPQMMINKSFHIDKHNQQVLMRVPEADNRVVRISSQGYRALRKIRNQQAKDKHDIMSRLESLFKEQSVVLTGRTKSTRSVLDKAARLSQQSERNQGARKYMSIMDIIDINGFRVTCFDSSQIFGIISQLQSAGFEILELDNKYNTIRKDGAYKVLPLTLLDPLTGNIFELQITTMPSTTVADLFHNVIYKKEAIGLGMTDEEQELVRKLQRTSALVETLNLFKNQFDLAHPFNEEQRSGLIKKLEKGGLKFN